VFKDKPNKDLRGMASLYNETVQLVALESSGIKTAYDLKASMRALKEAGFELEGPFFDARIAGWCLDPSRSKPDLGALLRETLGAELPEGAGPSARAAVLPALAAGLSEQLEEQKLSKVYETLELPLVAILARMEETGIALDVEYLQALRGEFASALAAIKGEIDALSGLEVNLNSPKQIGELLFAKLGLKPSRKTKGGAPSTDEETLHELAAQHPVPAKLLAYREVSKLQSTYVEGLLAKVSPSTRRVHTHFNQTGTETGRLSSLDPNLQNIPVRTPLGQKIRRAFIAGKGQVLLSADYSQIGSNNWVVAGDLTRGGRPLLANDPHRTLALPSLRYTVHLNGPGWNVIGAGEPALPGVAAGHNDHVAFGFTIVGIDQQDLYVEQLNPGNPDEYLYQGDWVPMEIERETMTVKGEAPRALELRFTRHGPVLHVDRARNRAYALRWVGMEPGTAGYLGSLSLNVARSWPEFLKALDGWKVPSENLVYADTAGHIGWVAAGSSSAATCSGEPKRP